MASSGPRKAKRYPAIPEAIDPHMVRRIRQLWHEHGLKLPRKRQAFVLEYVRDYNGRQAAIRAGYSPKTANEMAARLLAIVTIGKAVELAMNEVLASAGTDAQAIERELARVGFARMSDLVEWDREGNVYLQPSQEVDPDSLAAVSQVKQVRQVRFNKDGEKIETVRLDFRLHDKVAALDKLARRHGLYREDNEQRAGVVVLVGAGGPPPGLVTDPQAYEEHVRRLRSGPLLLDAGQTGPEPTGREIGATPSDDDT